MRKLITYAPALALLAAGCTSVDSGLHHTVVLHYQHVANVHRIDFSSPVVLTQRGRPVQAVLPLESQGFWAVFVLCSVDASATFIPSFYFDVDRFRVADGKQRFGPLRPWTLRLDDTSYLNTRTDTPAIAQAIAMEVQEGPSSQVFRHGFYGGLDYRFAIYLPRGLPDYSGEELTLRYEGGQTMVLGNGYPPSDIPVAGLGGNGIASRCLP